MNILFDADGLLLIHGDACEVQPLLGTVFDAVISDPPWGSPAWADDAAPEDFLLGNASPADLLARIALDWPRLASRVVVILGIDTDPRILTAIPASMPYLRTVWLRRTPPTFRGRIMRQADVAHVFGPANPGPGSGFKVFAGEIQTASLGRRLWKSSHPCPRSLDHMERLVTDYSQPGGSVLDPFSGSGTTAVACYRTGRRCTAIEIDETHARESADRMRFETGQRRQFAFLAHDAKP